MNIKMLNLQKVQIIQVNNRTFYAPVFAVFCANKLESIHKLL